MSEEVTQENQKVNSNEVVLRNGKKIAIKEVTALEDLLCWQIIGKNSKKDDNEMGVGMLFRKISVVLGIDSIDGKPVVPPSTINEVMATLAQFKKKDWDKIEDKYDQINGEEESVPGE